MKKIQARIWDSEGQCYHYPDREGRAFAIAIGGLVCAGCIDGEMTTGVIDEEGKQKWEAELSTNLIDSNGKPIYEGDILEWSAPNDKMRVEHRGLVRYADDGCYMAGSGLLSAVAWRSEIIGNVRENPLLLNEENN